MQQQNYPEYLLTINLFLSHALHHMQFKSQWFHGCLHVVPDENHWVTFDNQRCEERAYVAVTHSREMR